MKVFSTRFKGSSGKVTMTASPPASEVSDEPKVLKAVTLALMVEPQVRLNGSSTKT